VKNTKQILSLVILLTISLGAMSALGGTIEPALSDRLAQAGDDPVRALVYLKDQVDIESLDAELRNSRVSLQERHEIVIGTLQDAARRSQAGLLADLVTEKGLGNITNFESHWLVNAVRVEGTASAVEALALRADVDLLGIDIVVSRASTADKSGLEPVPVGDKTVDLGLESLRVPEVWHRLGIDGSGQIVGLIDTGVDGYHEALAGSWRGNSAPAAEAWFEVVDTGNPDFPVDLHFQGTLLAGLMVGHAGTDTFGVAPGAEWIAANQLMGPTGVEFDANLISCLEFFADPDGNPATVDDVPAVVLNAWGINEGYEGYTDCDRRWYAAIDACEAAGPVLIFGVGATGPAAGTILSPADRSKTETTSFCVGSVQSEYPFDVTDLSARGPSGCSGPYPNKPEVVAPGIALTTTYPDNGYVYYSSVEGSAALVAGVVALMRQAAPDADAETIKLALLNTAMDLGAPGDENGSGFGLVDAYAAVLAVMPGNGTAAGTITDLATVLPLEGALLSEVGGSHQYTTGPDGSWNLTMPPGSYVFDVTQPGYFDGTLAVTVGVGQHTTGDLALAPRPLYTVSGTVTGPGGTPVAGATVLDLTQPSVATLIDADGNYSFDLPGGAGLTHNLVAWGPWEGDEHAQFELNANLTQDFTLAPKLGDGFETGGFYQYEWLSGGEAQWVVDESQPRTGRFSVRSPDLATGGLSVLALEFWAEEAGQLIFHFRVDNYPEADYLIFYMDQDFQGEWTGDIPWTEFTVDVTQGHHQFEWFHLQQSGGFYNPTVWLDDITLPPTAEEPLAVITVAPLGLTAGAPQMGSATASFDITNSGTHPLDIAIQPESVAKAAGGPDGWGYTWIDSDEAGGPVYEWIDITADGTPLGLGNEETAYEVDLGFPILFYGGLFDELHIMSNGYMSFTETNNLYLNRAIPNAGNPNAIISPFWDDLNPATGTGEVWFKSEPENGRFIVTWDGVDHDGTSVTETFQAILYVDGTIVFQYAEANSVASCTVGIESLDGWDGLQVIWNTPDYIRPGLAVRINPVPPIPWIACDPWAVRVMPGETRAVEVAMDATDLAPGNHLANLRITSNDRAAGEQVVGVTFTVADISGVGEVPGVVAFKGAVPNPFNPRTTLHFSLPERGRISLKVYDVMGRLVRTLEDGRFEAGQHRTVWDGFDDGGRNVASGRYIARLEVDGVPLVKPMTLVR